MRTAAIFVLAAALLPAAGFKAGLARTVITPKAPIRMSGYAGRTQLSEGAVHDLWAKALALDDGKGGRAVIVTLDLATLPVSMADEVAARIGREHGLPRERLVLNCSHTHAGPVVRSGGGDEYSRGLADAIVRVAGEALKDLAPARLRFGHGSAGFAGNRREPTPQGIKIGVNPKGPVDHDVPVLEITDVKGRVRGILFGYACHNTTLTAKNLVLSGDYAGFAQAELEKRHPGATALFLQLCGGDQNPNPRQTMALAEKHGGELASAVARAMAGKMRNVKAPLGTAWETAELAFPPHTRETFERKLKDPNPLRARHAARMLKAYDEGKPVRSIPYPVQALRFGRDLTMVFLSGEVVVDYALRVKKEFRGGDVVVAGYSNHIPCYIPSLRVLKEGGYEADESLLWDDMPGPFAEDVEERIMATVKRVMAR